MASYISAKKKEMMVNICSDCSGEKIIVGSIRNEIGELKSYCKDCFEERTGKKVSKR